jgi:hypothetical protein
LTEGKQDIILGSREGVIIVTYNCQDVGPAYRNSLLYEKAAVTAVRAVERAAGSLKSGNKHAGGNGRWPNNLGSCGACTMILIAPAVAVEAPVAAPADKKSAERQPGEYFTNEFGRSVKVGADDVEALRRAAEYQPPTREAQLQEVRQAMQLGGSRRGQKRKAR